MEQAFAPESNGHVPGAAAMRAPAPVSVSPAHTGISRAAHSNRVPPRPASSESLYRDFLDPLDAWGRRVLAANGFGDY